MSEWITNRNPELSEADWTGSKYKRNFLVWNGRNVFIAVYSKTPRHDLLGGGFLIGWNCTIKGWMELPSPPEEGHDRKEARYTTTDIAKIGIKRERLKNWMEKGYIVPSIQKATGSGTMNIFNRFDLYGLLLFRDLTELGFAGAAAKSISNNVVVNFIEDAFDTLFFIYNRSSSGKLQIRRTVFKACDLNSYLNNPACYNAIFVVNWAKLREIVDNLRV